MYLNHAAVAPLAGRAAEAMQHLAQDALDYGSVHYARWMETYQGVRVAAAASDQRDAGRDRHRQEHVRGNRDGGDRYFAGSAAMWWWRFEEEFPANFYPWKRLEATGVEVRWLSIFDDLDRIDTACKGARMLAISFVQYLSGYRVDLEEIGEICARHGCFFLVDAIQGMGAFPIDVRAAKIDALAADGHKWLLGPEGCGVLYVRQDVQDEIEPIEFGWTNVAKYVDYASRDMALRPDAGRYECGTLNTIGCYGLRASMDFLLEVGMENTAPCDAGAGGPDLQEGVSVHGFRNAGAAVGGDRRGHRQLSESGRGEPVDRAEVEGRGHRHRAAPGLGAGRAAFLYRAARRSIACSTSSGLSEDNDVLLRQNFDRLVEPETFRLHFRPHLLHRHLMFRPDRHLRIFAAVFQKHEPAVRLQRFPNTVEHFLGLGELVIDIHQQDEIERILRQLRIVDRSQHRPHVVEMPLRHILRQLIEHAC